MASLFSVASVGSGGRGPRPRRRGCALAGGPRDVPAAVDREVAALVLVAGGLDAEPAMALVDLARANDEAGFLGLAGTVGLSGEASTTLWVQTRRRLGVPVTARVR